MTCNNIVRGPRQHNYDAHDLFPLRRVLGLTKKTGIPQHKRPSRIKGNFEPHKNNGATDRVPKSAVCARGGGRAWANRGRGATAHYIGKKTPHKHMRTLRFRAICFDCKAPRAAEPRPTKPPLGGPIPPSEPQVEEDGAAPELETPATFQDSPVHAKELEWAKSCPGDHREAELSHGFQELDRNV